MLIYLESLGCCRNQIDSEVMLGRLVERGHEICHDPSLAEVIIVNTCGFIATASEEAVDTILEMARYKTSGLCLRLVVTGCLPERFRDDEPGLAQSLPEVDAFLGTGAVDAIVCAVEENSGKTFSLFPDTLKRNFQGYPLPRQLTIDFSAYCKVSEGCNRKCTYCIIPVLRGIQRSRPVEDVVKEAENLFLKGVKEIILVGENTSDYGSDLFFDRASAHETEINSNHKTVASHETNSNHKTVADYEINSTHEINSVHEINSAHETDLAEVLKKVSLKASEIYSADQVWIRVLYTHPSSLSKNIIKSISHFDNICSYYDVPVQHASSRVLKKMGRNYTREDLYSLFYFIREADPDAALRTTIITGFPGETEEDFQVLLKFIEDIKFDHLGVFIYSDSDDLKSHGLKDHVSKEVATARYDMLMVEQMKISEKINEKHFGRVYKVLVEENPDNGIYLGRTAFQAPEVDGITFIYGTGIKTGSFVDVKITETYEYDLAGEIV
ncbi:MAG: MiaB/RimO family radical SAM methylthiotransferase [Thermodesulfobacteriota bacterium]|nr:MiaB/RimO family radical SAM methylthiotransferase [Thermodesulfobacteriota bacterium]